VKGVHSGGAYQGANVHRKNLLGNGSVTAARPRRSLQRFRTHANDDDISSSTTTTTPRPSIFDDPPSAPPRPSIVDDPLAAQFKTMYPAGSGKTIKWGVFKEDVVMDGASNDPSVREELRNAATANLTNINADERGRRYKAGAAAAVFCAALAAFQLATGAPPPQRALMALPLFFALGFTGSGATGL